MKSLKAMLGNFQTIEEQLNAFEQGSHIIKIFFQKEQLLQQRVDWLKKEKHWKKEQCLGRHFSNPSVKWRKREDSRKGNETAFNKDSIKKEL